MKFSIEYFLVNMYLVKFKGEIFNKKLCFLCGGSFFVTKCLYNQLPSKMQFIYKSQKLLKSKAFQAKLSLKNPFYPKKMILSLFITPCVLKTVGILVILG